MAERIGQYMFAELAPVQPTSGKTKRWVLRNRGSNDILGAIGWYGSWRQYCFFPTGEPVFSAGCLRDVAAFLEKVKDERAI